MVYEGSIDDLRPGFEHDDVKELPSWDTGHRLWMWDMHIIQILKQEGTGHYGEIFYVAEEMELGNDEDLDEQYRHKTRYLFHKLLRIRMM